MPKDTTINFKVGDQYYEVTGSPEFIDSVEQAAHAEYAAKQHWVPYKTHEDFPFFKALAIILSMAIVFYKLNSWLEPFITRFQQKFGRLLETEIAPPAEDDDDDAAPSVTEPAEITERAEAAAPALVYKGRELNFTETEIVQVLQKHFVYFGKLSPAEQSLFLYRLQEFMRQKNFIIHDKSGFKEMPILISASAVQLSFGLRNFLLPHFTEIHIFPGAFVGYYPRLRLLEGNVSGNAVNLSWQHFLDGYKMPDNGQNVGLHEFAHAYYYQYFETGGHAEPDFVHAFPSFNKCGSVAFEKEQQPGNDLYSDYALTDFQEFWAESAELFFEKPLALKTAYPDLYEAICHVLNQDPAGQNSGFA